MKNTNVILDILHQIQKTTDTSEQITYAMASEHSTGRTDLLLLYEEQRFDELEHLQKLILKLTDLIQNEEPVEPVNNDEGSVFAEGELTAKKDAPVESGEENREGGGTNGSPETN